MDELQTKAAQQRRIRIEKLRDNVEESELRVRLLEAKAKIRELQAAKLNASQS